MEGLGIRPLSHCLLSMTCHSYLLLKLHSVGCTRKSATWCCLQGVDYLVRGLTDEKRAMTNMTRVLPGAGHAKEGGGKVKSREAEGAGFCAAVECALDLEG